MIRLTIAIVFMIGACLGFIDIATQLPQKQALSLIGCIILFALARKVAGSLK